MGKWGYTGSVYFKISSNFEIYGTCMNEKKYLFWNIQNIEKETLVVLQAHPNNKPIPIKTLTLTTTFISLLGAFLRWKTQCNNNAEKSLPPR